LKGERSPALDIIAMNAGAAVYVSGQAATLKDGAEYAKEAIISGKALDLLQRMVEMNGDQGKLARFL
jgi:anthranilate phosphoribosyltransferase